MKYWHRWERFLIVLQAENEPTYILLATAFGWKRYAITTFKPEIIVTNSGGAIIPGFENNNFNERGTNYFTCTDCKERKSYRRSFGKFRPL
jgi:hypothetical protein